MLKSVSLHRAADIFHFFLSAWWQGHQFYTLLPSLTDVSAPIYSLSHHIFRGLKMN